MSQKSAIKCRETICLHRSAIYQRRQQEHCNGGLDSLLKMVELDPQNPSFPEMWRSDSCRRDEGKNKKERSCTPLLLAVGLGKTYPIGVLVEVAFAPEVSTRITP